MKDPLDFSGKVALVTGSSRGIGAATIKALGECNAKCLVNYVPDPDGKNKPDAHKVAQTLADPLIIQCDVSDPAQVESMIMEIGDKRGDLDLLVNNAGIIRDRTINTMTL